MGAEVVDGVNVLADASNVSVTNVDGKHCWTEKLALSCSGCGLLKDGGWPTANRDYYCRACWEAHWDSFPPESWAIRHAESRPKRSKKMLCMLMGSGCKCCDPPSHSPAADGEDDSKSYRALFLEPDLPELCGLEFSDAHCHLDVLLQNNKHGGIGWDSKQKICKYWLEGECPFDGFCEYAHGEHELKVRIALCREDIEPYLQHYAGKRKANNGQPLPNGENSLEGPILGCLVTNCCEVAAIEDTKLILAIADNMHLGTVFCSFGCHPHDYRAFTDAMEQRFFEEVTACGRSVVAWGECGLDYCKNFHESSQPAERKRMMDVFARQARIAVAKQLPLIVHSRDAERDTMEVLRECLPRDHKFHVHAYQGKLDMMYEALELFPNCIFGVSGMIMHTYPSEGAVLCAKHCPLERLVLETDAPYLTGGPHDIPRLAQHVAELKDLSPAKVMVTTSANCQRFYGVHELLANLKQQVAPSDLRKEIALVQP